MLLQLQDYIQKHHVVSLEELVAHFQVPPAMIELILSQLIRKGRVKKIIPSHCGSCHQCGFYPLELYEWRINNAIPSNDQPAQ
ncbi:FeoC-like transcriptional regulator [Thermosynechococcus sp. TG252]|uniref:FeoC-like transcriptional regulator n=1 Tax=Thermosynechococcus sp. TG252 TaxID=3074097 RepID=UPI0028619C9E|nr:FeoC-like transcriptional regulator [Thermosynechococcus sp. TG252]MDR7992299.1 FeoC-like transcriptional regulator [Thermosynechococcus sp. TG252]